MKTQLLIVFALFALIFSSCKAPEAFQEFQEFEFPSYEEMHPNLKPILASTYSPVVYPKLVSEIDVLYGHKTNQKINHIVRAQQMIAAEKFTDALHFAERARNLGNSPESLLLLASIYLRIDKPEMARQLRVEASRLDPEYVRRQEEFIGIPDLFD